MISKLISWVTEGKSNISEVVSAQAEIQNLREHAFIDMAAQYQKSILGAGYRQVNCNPRLCNNCGFECISDRCPKCRTYGIKA